VKQVGHTGFLLNSQNVRRGILIPRYYDPEITQSLHALKGQFDLVELKRLIVDGKVLHSHGDYVPKIHYGTGPYPYIRTSDLANWEVKASPKHGVPRAVLDEYAPSQDIQVGDIFFVHEGTYLIGSVAMVTEQDGAMLYQHHLAKFRVLAGAPFNKYFLLAALEAPLVRRQIRSKQFSADIIDSVVGRLDEVVIPCPKDHQRLIKIEETVESAVLRRARLRRMIAEDCKNLDFWLSGATKQDRVSDALSVTSTHESSPAFLGGRRGFNARALSTKRLVNNILLPRYYDPEIETALISYRARCNVISVGDLERRGQIRLTTGDEIGRMNYGTGNIPFVRTSDFGSWELKREAKQGVSEAVYKEWATRQGVLAGDILLVRDGTYLVGTSVLVAEQDLPLLFCGGIYRIRSEDWDTLPPAFLFAVLNTPFVRRQMRNKQFTRDVIDTLGQRLSEVFLPIPKDPNDVRTIASKFSASLDERVRLRAELHKVSESMFTTQR